MVRPARPSGEVMGIILQIRSLDKPRLLGFRKDGVLMFPYRGHVGCISLPGPGGCGGDLRAIRWLRLIAGSTDGGCFRLLGEGEQCGPDLPQAATPLFRSHNLGL